jgi:hypothetical protein
MAIPTCIQPNLAQRIKDQNNISHSLFNVILNIVKTREELERSWFSISNDIDLVDAQEREILGRNNAN